MSMTTTGDLRQGLLTALRFYKAFGFERLPLFIEKGETLSARGRTLSPSEKDTALLELRKEIGDCKRCGLAGDRRNIVFGAGRSDARIMFIGEAPGAEEDRQGEPFVGDAGQILTSLINKMGREKGFSFTREDVYIANIVKCRPPMNRDPLEEEISACLPFLKRQIETISPEVVISLGKVSAHTLLEVSVPISSFSISRTRGRFYEFKSAHGPIPVMPTFHPAYFLRNPGEKKKTWEDAMLVLEKLKQTGRIR